MLLSGDWSGAVCGFDTKKAMQARAGTDTHIAMWATSMVKSSSQKEIAPNMPAKKSRSKPGLKKTTITKSDFIRQQPSSLSAAEIVAKANAAGIKFAPVLVYKVRGRAKAKRSAKKAPAIVTTAPTAAVTKPAKSKSAFIRSLPSSTPARDVVKQAKASGIKLNVGYVYNVRGAAKKAKRTSRNGASVARPITTPSSAENLLKAVAAEIGLGRAIEVLEGERARVRAVLRG